MSAISILLLLLICLHTFYAVGWWGAGVVLSVNRAASLQWVGYCLALGLGVFLFMSSLGLPPAWTVALRILSLLGACVLMRRGLARFGHYRSSDLEHAGVLLLAVLGIAWAGTGDADMNRRTLIVTTLMAWSLARQGLELFAGLRVEFGARVVTLMASPPLLLCGCMVLRLANVWIHGDDAAPSRITDETPFNIAVMFILVVASALFQIALVYLVIDRLVRRLRHLSHHDALTGLFNRHAWDQALVRERLQLRRRPRPTTVMIIDIDHFKRINDRHGHLGGDAALREVARCIQATARGTDVVARLGGEEFVLLLPDTDLSGASLAAERVREAVARLPLRIDDQPLSLTVSVGAGVMHLDRNAPIDLHALVALADRLLYRAKAEGRNRVLIDALPDQVGLPAT